MEATDSRRRTISVLFWVACIAAALLVLAAYSNSLDNSFHFDDAHVIEENIFIRDLRNVPRFFTDARTFSSIPTNATYRPIVSTTLALDYRMSGGLAPRAFHVTQLFLFLVTGALLAALYVVILSRTPLPEWHRWTALLGATLFCIHTGNTQPVNYISARSELLSGIGVLGCLLVFARLPRARRFQLHLIPMVFGALAKTPAVIAAPLLLAYALLIEQRLSVRELFTRQAWPRARAALVATAPAFVLALGLYVFVEGMNPPGQTYGGGGRLRYLMTESWVWIHYARMFVLPNQLSADTDLDLFPSPWDLRVLAGVVFAAALVALIVWGSKRDRTRPVALGIAWFAIALLPSSSILPLAEVANDHRAFLPYMGLTLAVISALSLPFARWLTVPRRAHAEVVATGALAIVVLAAHTVGTHQRNRVWKNEETLWADVVQKSPSNGRGLMNYGVTMMEQGDYARAQELFIRADSLLPNYSTLQVNLGIAANGLGNTAAADSHFNRALQLNPTHPATHRYYARWLVRQGRAGEALPHLERTLELSPADPEARHMLMELEAARASERLLPLAVETLRLASDDSIAAHYARGEPPFRPDTVSAAAWYRMGVAFTHDDRHAEAAQAYRAAIAIDSTNASAWNDLGWSLAKLGFFGEAIPAFRSALRHEPQLELAANNLAWAMDQASSARFQEAFALQQTGHPADAVPIYRELLAAFPKWTNAHYNLGHSLMALGRHAEAIAEFRAALALDPGLHAVHLHLATCLEAVGAADEAQRERDLYERSQATSEDHSPRRPS